jgi:hypothetical protein
VKRVFSLWPFYDQDRVSSVAGDKTWVCTERIDVEQKGSKVREVDSATVSMSNKLTRITEKLQLPTTHKNVGMIKAFYKKRRRHKVINKKLKGWMRGKPIVRSG